MRTRTMGVRAAATALAVTVVAGGVAACGSEDEPAAPEAHLQIIASDSSEVVTVDATEGSEATLDTPYADDGGVDIEVGAVDGDEVELTTGEDMTPVGENGGINLRDLASRFTVTKGDELEMSTPTMDGSTRFTVTVEDGPAPS